MLCGFVFLLFIFFILFVFLEFSFAFLGESNVEGEVKWFTTDYDQVNKHLFFSKEYIYAKAKKELKNIEECPIRYEI